MSRRARVLSLTLLSTGLALALAGQARAATVRTASYAFDKVWPTAVRFLRIDEELVITEKDAEAGYILFEGKNGDKTYTGALEVISESDELGRDAVRLVLRIKERPSYVELAILDRFLGKLKEELGQPPPPPKPAKPPPKKDDAKPDHKAARSPR